MGCWVGFPAFSRSSMALLYPSCTLDYLDADPKRGKVESRRIHWRLSKKGPFFKRGDSGTIPREGMTKWIFRGVGKSSCNINNFWRMSLCFWKDAFEVALHSLEVMFWWLFFLAWMVFEVCKWSLSVRVSRLADPIFFSVVWMLERWCAWASYIVLSCESYQKQGLDTALIGKTMVVHKHPWNPYF